jgi:hypothetical protein
VDSVLSEGEQHIHDGEREEDVRVGEDPPPCTLSSIRQVGSFDRLRNPPPSRSAPLTTGLEGQDIREAHAAVAAAREALEGDLALVEQPHDEGSGEAEQFGRLCRGEGDLGREHGDGSPVGQLVGGEAQDLDQGGRQRQRAAVRELEM